MNLTLHELSIGSSLMRPISKQDNRRQTDWLDMHLPELFSLAKLQLTEQRRAALICSECASTGQHQTEDCPFPKTPPLFPEMEMDQNQTK